MASENSEPQKMESWWTRLAALASETGLSAPERLQLRIDRLEKRVQDIERRLRFNQERSP